MTESCIHEKS